MKIIKAICWMLVALVSAPIATENCPAIHLGKMTVRTMRITAYCPCHLCCGKNACGITASGHKIKAGEKIAAADKSISFGTILDIPGYGKAAVLDRGSAIRGNRLDVYFDFHKDALNWGSRILDVAFYE
jgi:3D (Asp-Asp-Asp) domain-containing protein